MNRNSLAGWKDVYSFTLRQTFKSKVFIVSYVLIVVIALFSVPIVGTITSDTADEIGGPNTIQKVYVNNETSLPIADFSDPFKEEGNGSIAFEAVSGNIESYRKRIDETENQAVLLTITEDEGIYSLSFAKSSTGPVSDKNIISLANAIAGQFEALKTRALGITEEQLAIITKDINTSVYMTDISDTPITQEDTSISNSEYWFIYGILFVVLMVNVLASTQIATSIVTEKSTRVVEYLLISVKPLSLMVGKILAMLQAVLMQIITFIAVLFLSNKVTTALLSDNGEGLIAQYLPADIFQNLNIVNIVFCLLLIALGMFFYAVLAGLAGATISRQEEITEGLTLFTLTNILGAYIGIGAANILMGLGSNGFVTFSFLFPLSSPFVLPGAILVGKASFPLAIAAIALQVVSIVLLLIFAARVYETLILHTGNKIKVLDLFKISKTASKGEIV